MRLCVNKREYKYSLMKECATCLMRSNGQQNVYKCTCIGRRRMNIRKGEELFVAVTRTLADHGPVHRPKTHTAPIRVHFRAIHANSCMLRAYYPGTPFRFVLSKNTQDAGILKEYNRLRTARTF